MTADASAREAARTRDLIDRPVLIVSTPRSGSTLLFETMVKAPGLFSVGDESHARIEQIADLFPGKRGWTSNRLEASDATPETVEALAETFYGALRDRDGRAAEGPIRMLEKTPKNALRVPFFDAAFNGSRFVYLYRDPSPTIASMLQAWVTGQFVTYPMLPGWGRPQWSLLLVPGWRDLIGRPLQEVIAHQWATTTNLLIDDLSRIPRERVVPVEHAELIADPQATMERLAKGVDLDWDVALPERLPLSKMTYSQPDPDKWRKIAHVIESVRPIIEPAERRARTFIESLRS